ncbi:ribbon-helix-helix domain-containing protein [Azospirillum sp. SYSU D00513]|uniref:ribbon-helix-helix domain-containing protein n=1 Tax=Azospirillum sp. SYSU D00513 TaxID=2812561 RepID=UPI001FFE7F40|nr:ribbon-helix-helix domain-containing protein [Azospirillum sp. SYSU D00513]
MPDPPGIGPLKSQNVIIAGHRTSMRLEQSMWDALDEIGRREGYNVNGLCTKIKERLDIQKRLKGIPETDREVTLTSAVRVFIASYFRNACNDGAHRSVGHSMGRPFKGTPFALPEDDEEPGDDDDPSWPFGSGSHGMKAMSRHEG